MKNRGTKDILLVVVDGLKSFPQVIRASFPDAMVQTCIVHLLRTSMDFVLSQPARPETEMQPDGQSAAAGGNYCL
jgi:putative transposase